MNYFCIFKEESSTMVEKYIELKECINNIDILEYIKTNFCITENTVIYFFMLESNGSTGRFYFVDYNANKDLYSISFINTYYWYKSAKTLSEKLFDNSDIKQISINFHQKYTYKNGILESIDDLPAVIHYDHEYVFETNLHISKKNPIQKCWYKNGKLHRDNGPAILEYNSHGEKSLYYKDGKKIKNKIDIYDDCIIQTDSYNNCIEKYYIKNRIRYKKKYNSNILIKEEYFNTHGQHHRENDLPAILEYYNTGELKYESWYINGNLHRIYNPAIITYMEEKIIIEQRYYLKGKYYTSFNKYISDMKDEFAQEYNAKLKEKSVDMFN